MLAARNNEHIKIDVLVQLLPQTAIQPMARLMNLFAAGVCLLTSYVCLQFVLIEHEFGVNAFALLPNWLVAIVLPLAFAAVGLRYLAPCREWQCFPAGGSSMILAATLSLLAAMLLGAPLFSVIFGGALLDFYAIEVDLSVVIAVDTPLLSSLAYSGDSDHPFWFYSITRRSQRDELIVSL